LCRDGKQTQFASETDSLVLDIQPRSVALDDEQQDANGIAVVISYRYGSSNQNRPEQSASDSAHASELR
jgi:hypothetical protein